MIIAATRGQSALVISRQTKVSVIVPAYNAENGIRKCIESIRAQTYQNLEIIVVDDESSDRTASILKELSAQDSRIKAIRAPQNLGVHGARRFGVSHAAGEFIGFADHDDYIVPEMYSTLHELLERSGAAIAICGVSTVVGGRLAGTKVAFRSSKTFENDVLSRFCRLKFGSGVLWNKLYRREVIAGPATTDLEREVDASEDYIVNFGAFARSSSVITCPARLYRYVLHSGNASARQNPWSVFARLFRAYVVCMEVYGPEDPAYPMLIDQLYLKQLHFPGYQIHNGDPSEANLAHLAESLRRLATINPRSIYSIVHSLPKWEHRFKQVRTKLLEISPTQKLRRLAS